MPSLILTRKQMAELLLSLQLDGCATPLEVLKQAWQEMNGVVEDGFANGLGESSLPNIFEKIIKGSSREIGFSINEIVSLGNQIEYSSFSTTAVQNWVKRDVRNLIGSPQKGKKYSLEQAAILFIVEDLKSTLDFVSIRNLLTLIFNDIEDRHDDIIDPIHFYHTYASIFEELDLNDDHVVDVDFRVKDGSKAEMLIYEKAEEKIQRLDDLGNREQSIVKNAMVIATLSVQTSYFQSVSRQFLNSTLFI
ncbi:DUF1836 domain-containing protein [Pseudalkalibacillus berkeleyi]|uniref:DUF1836 domain-containing protein n=1 Tax=Pseudalkalibacillus berkeleyi TaxID=1069813 RepID=A0ABS9GXG3_9BACL|nr:DUF1836 domain-containing protein [Pseudalkalibacillus berkeleyi]MCF6136295.1 DUF1836 domain-containing protein [Pseudalkalibacillus berkeleyi]